MLKQTLYFSLLFSAFAARPRISIEGHPELDLPPNREFTRPDHVKVYDDDNFYSVLKANDVVVMFVREDHCPDCDHFMDAYYNTTKELKGVEGVSVGQIDIHEASDTFAEYHGVEEDLPAILVFKAEDTRKYQKRPVNFVVNDRLRHDLCPFVKRMRGPAYRMIASVEDLQRLERDADEYADGLALLVYNPAESGVREATKKKRQMFADILSRKVAEIERYNTVVGLVDAKFAGFAAALPQHDFGGDISISSLQTSYSPSQITSLLLPTEGSAIHDVKSAVHKTLSWVHNEKTKRRGHKHDNIITYYQEDLHVPSNYSDANNDKINTTTKRYIRLVMEGRVSNTHALIFARELEMITLENTTMIGIERALLGMSTGMKRLVIIPKDLQEGWKFDPIELHSSSMLHVTLKVKYIGDTNELPGRIEWETDPEKIAEHKRKSDEQDKERKEAILRGEDPDAKCNKKP